ncbi:MULTISPECIES: hypothetical protein [unclassified Polaromonas]|uniref:hypothetical protein n=1 Tax=unclassified Polaromonas TaxID=2638319 RepID=UPI0018956914|nr:MULTISPECIES: hypothetical protein [unclassified Polaromonas]
MRRLFRIAEEITSRRWQQQWRQQQLRRLQEQQRLVRMRQQQVLEQRQVLEQQLVRVLAQELLPSCRKQPEQQRQR